MKTITFEGRGNLGAYYVIQLAGEDNVNVSGDSFYMTALAPTALASVAWASMRQASVVVDFYYSYEKFHVQDASGWSVWGSGQTKPLTRNIYYNNPISTSAIFNSANKTERYVTVYYTTINSGGSAIGNGTDVWEAVPSGSSFTLGQTITLDAPPTFRTLDSSGQETNSVWFNTPYVYSGFTTASIKVDASSGNYGAKYGGYIAKIQFEIGTQKVYREFDANNPPTSAELFSIPLSAGGDFTPIVTVTDSRGQTKSYNLERIHVNVYSKPTVEFVAERTLSTGVPDDEGEYAVINPKLTFTDDIATLQSPLVSVTDENGVVSTPTVSWYTTRASDGTLNGSVTWGSLSSGDTVYGLLSRTLGFDKNESYQISITARDSEDSGDPISQTLAPAFYTVDFLAGGHGIAFGQPATQDGFFCNMDAHFVDKSDVMRALFDFMYPVGSYYETSDTSFNPNNTWGGTWVLETAGQVHVSAGTGYSVNGANNNTSDGGEATHTLTINEMPSHAHGCGLDAYGSLTGSAMKWGYSTSRGVYDSGYDIILNTGGGQAHNNMPPYIVVNRWHRTA